MFVCLFGGAVLWCSFSEKSYYCEKAIFDADTVLVAYPPLYCGALGVVQNLEASKKHKNAPRFTYETIEQNTISTKYPPQKKCLHGINATQLVPPPTILPLIRIRF